MDFDSFWKDVVGNVQNFAAVCSVAIISEMHVHLLLEPDVIPLGRVGGCRCESPPHVHLPRCVVLNCIVPEIMWGDLVKPLADILGDFFDNLPLGVRCGKVIAKEGLVEGEHAFDLDAEGDLKGGVDHVESRLRMM